MNRIILLSLLCCSLFSQMHAQVNLSSSLVAYYPFNGTFNDASGNANHGTGMNGVTYGTDQWGNTNNAAFFDGVNDWVSILPSLSSTPGHALTVTLRFKANATGRQYLVTKAELNTYDFFCYNVGFNDPTSVTGTGIVFGSGHDNICNPPTIIANDYLTTGTALSSGVWYCIVVLFDNGVKKIYINGVLIAQQTVSSAISPTKIDSCTNAGLKLGTWCSTDPAYFSGLMDEVRIYSRALNTQEIDSVCNLITLPSSDTIINRYAAVTARGACSNAFTVDTATGFAAGDTILMIQMKGATIDTSNTASFGSVLAYNGAGNYEYNVVSAVSGNNISLRYLPLRSYDIPAGKVQFVRVPSYTNYTVSRKHTCLPWTGAKGGVFAIRVAGALTLNSDIDVSGRGFRGGQPQFSNLYSCNKTDYYYPGTNNEGGKKGEGIAAVSLAKAYGRGAQANGGGGGNDHNSGGGGGANYSSGGVGGNQYNLGPCATNPNIGGIGGVALTSSPFTRAFLGGGGGCGHGNDTGEKAGGTGGGIIFITSSSLVGNGYSLMANGGDAPECSSGGVVGGGCLNDGGGGGGGGGLVYSTVTAISGSLSVKAVGGKGSNVFVSPSIPSVGPGGGGSGGAWAALSGSTTSGVVFYGNGGAAGVLTQYSNTNYGAQPGASGQAVASSAIPQATVIYVSTTVTPGFTDSAVSCFTHKFINTTASSSAGGLSYSWSFGPGTTTSTLQSPTYSFPGYGTYTVTLAVTDANGCISAITKTIAIPFVHFAQGLGDTITCNGHPVYLNALGGISYSWSPAATLATPGAAYTKAFPAVTTTYTVTVTDGRGCVDSDDVVITVQPPANSVRALPKDTAACRDAHVQFFATGAITYQWTPADAFTNANSPTPIATVKGDMQYIVTGSNADGCVTSDTVNMHELPGPDVHAASEGIASSCNHIFAKLFATGTALTYKWSPDTYVTNSIGTSTTASPPVTQVFTLTGTDSLGCRSTDTVTVYAANSPVVFMPDAFSPNGDNRNDMIHPFVYCDFTLDEYRIYNRWGEVVFTANDVSRAWNGYFGGLPADVGIYSYLIIGKRPSTSQRVLYKGNFTLIR